MKRALLIGINYYGSSVALNGCINDINNIRELLIRVFKYDPKNITVLDDRAANLLKPTKANINKFINQMVALTKAGDTLFLHYSGHGSQVRDVNGDEKLNLESVNMDDVLCPCDYLRSGFIRDDDLKNILVNKLVKGAKLRAFFDCCHSGTMLDLPYIYRNNVFQLVESLNKLSDDCLAISGCKDNQTSADAYIDKKYSGALTWALLKTLKNNQTVPTTWNLLLTLTQYNLSKGRYSQVPVLQVGNKELLNKLIDL